MIMCWAEEVAWYDSCRRPLYSCVSRVTWRYGRCSSIPAAAMPNSKHRAQLSAFQSRHSN